MIAATQLFPAQPERMVPAGDREVVRKLIAPQHLVVGQEDVRSQVRHAENVQSHLGRLIRNHVHVVVAVLRPYFILGARTKQVEP